MKAMVWLCLVGVALVVLTGCGKEQVAPVQPPPTPAEQPLLTSSQVQAIRAAIEDVERHYAALKVQCASQRQRFDKATWGTWSSTWNQQRSTLQDRITRLPQAQSTDCVGVAVRDLFSLWQEYGKALEGQKDDAAFFEGSVEEWLESAKAALPAP